MNARKLPMPWLAPVTGMLFVVNLSLTLLSVAFYGLDTPLSHALAGAAALFFMLFIISERYHSSPLIPRHLRNSLPLQITLWASIFITAVTFAAGFLLVVAMYQLYGLSVPGIILSFVPALLLMRAGTLLGEKLVRGISTSGILLWGFMIGAGGLGIMVMTPAPSPFWLALLPGMLLVGTGAGLARYALVAHRDRLRGDEYHYAVRLGGGIQAGSTVVMLALLTLLLRNHPGQEGIENGFSLLGALALAGVVTALMAPGQGRRTQFTARQSGSGRFHRQE